MAVLDVDGAQLRYEVEGEGAHTLAFVHGWCSKAAHWDAQVEALGTTYRTVRWDRRGMGGSTCREPAAGPERHADDLAAILDHEGIDRATVIGHAGGFPAALTFAVRHGRRTDGLVAVDTGIHVVPPAGEPDPFAQSILRSSDKLQEAGEPYFRRLYATFFGHRAAPAVVEDAIANALATPLPLAAAEMRAMLTDTASLAAQVTCPVLWVSVRPDDTALVQRVFGDVVIGHVVGSGHFVQLEVPEQLNPMITAFLTDKVYATA